MLSPLLGNARKAVNSNPDTSLDSQTLVLVMTLNK